VKRYALSLLLLVCLFVPLLSAAEPPEGYANVSISGLATTIPTLDTVNKNYVAMLMNTSIISLVNEGLVNPAAVANEVMANARVFCAESQNTAPGCADVAAATQPYADQAKFVFTLVPASQWDPLKATANLPVFASAYLRPPAPAAPAPGTKPKVGTCFKSGGVTACYPNPGSSLGGLTDGQTYAEGGKVYSVSITTGLMGQAVVFYPLGQ
jgi:hypothetical protein